MTNLESKARVYRTLQQQQGNQKGEGGQSRPTIQTRQNNTDSSGESSKTAPTTRTQHKGAPATAAREPKGTETIPWSPLDPPHSQWPTTRGRPPGHTEAGQPATRQANRERTQDRNSKTATHTQQGETPSNTKGATTIPQGTKTKEPTAESSHKHRKPHKGTRAHKGGKTGTREQSWSLPQGKGPTIHKSNIPSHTRTSSTHTQALPQPKCTCPCLCTP